MQENIRVSIITIVYNGEAVIENTIQSVINQTYENMEYVIIDGKSNDDTINVIEKYRDKIDIVISEKDNGISDAFNKGIRNATGDIIFFLNAGDCFVDDMIIDNMVTTWKEEKTDVLFYKVKVGEHTFIPATSYCEDEIRIWNECQVPHQGAFIKRELFEKIGCFNQFIKVRMDFDFFARCKKNNCSYKYIPKVIVLYEEGGTSMRVENAKKFYREGLAIKMLYGLKITVKDVLYVVMPMWIRAIGKKIIQR